MNKIAAPNIQEKALRARIALNASDLESHRRLARICVYGGNTQEAAELFGRILQQNATDVEALTNLAFFYLERGGFDHAFTLLNAILSINPNNKAIHYQLEALKAVTERVASTAKYSEFYDKISGAEDKSLAIGLKRESIPSLIEVNGDLIWIPGDLLRFLWHTVQKPLKSFIPTFRAETYHYVWIRDKLAPGDTVLDIGSNIGIFATMMGTKVGPKGRVYAFEPSARIAADLRRVLTLNGLHQVTVVEAAASNQNGEATFCEVQEEDVRRESSHLNDPTFDRSSPNLKQKSVRVKTVVVDEIATTNNLKPKIIKIDVEGAEFLVLEGLRKTIGAFKPKLVIEFHPNAQGVFDHEKLASYLIGSDYEFKVEDKTYYCW